MSALRGRARRRPFVALALAFAAGAAATAVSCTIPRDDEPQPIAADALPKSLREANPSTSTTSPQSDRSQQRTIYLVQKVEGGEKLVPVSVEVTLPGDPAQATRAVIDKLVNSPPLGENSAFTTAIPPGMRVLGVARQGDVLDINLANLQNVESTRQRLAVAQIVYTATAAANTGGQPVTGVRFSIDGEPTPVPVDDRTAEPGTVITRSDLDSLRPSATTTTLPEPEPAPVTPTSR